MKTNMPPSNAPDTVRATLVYLASGLFASLLAGAYIVNWPAFVTY